ncbi:MAG: hypothetical protein ACOYL6_18110 [Bacteriovoracaceae bacterium]
MKKYIFLILSLLLFQAHAQMVEPIKEFVDQVPKLEDRKLFYDQINSRFSEELKDFGKVTFKNVSFLSAEFSAQIITKLTDDVPVFRGLAATNQTCKKLRNESKDLLKSINYPYASITVKKESMILDTSELDKLVSKNQLTKSQVSRMAALGESQFLSLNGIIDKVQRLKKQIKVFEEYAGSYSTTGEDLGYFQVTLTTPQALDILELESAQAIKIEDVTTALSKLTGGSDSFSSALILAQEMKKTNTSADEILKQIKVVKASLKEYTFSRGGRSTPGGIYSSSITFNQAITVINTSKENAIPLNELIQTLNKKNLPLADRLEEIIEKIEIVKKEKSKVPSEEIYKQVKKVQSSVKEYSFAGGGRSTPGGYYYDFLSFDEALTVVNTSKETAIPLDELIQKLNKENIPLADRLEEITTAYKEKTKTKVPIEEIDKQVKEVQQSIKEYTLAGGSRSTPGGYYSSSISVNQAMSVINTAKETTIPLDELIQALNKENISLVDRLDKIRLPLGFESLSCDRHVE